MDMTLTLLEAVKEDKIPLWEKYKDECPESNFCHLFVNRILKKSMDTKVQEQLDEEMKVKKGILEPRDNTQ
jgi:hypothetical protein